MLSKGMLVFVTVHDIVLSQCKLVWGCRIELQYYLVGRSALSEKYWVGN